MYETLINNTIRSRGILEIEYENGRGEISSRRIRPHRSYRSAAGRTYVEAWCEKRQEERTFRTDRISAARTDAWPVATSSPRSLPRQGPKEPRPTHSSRPERKGGGGLIAVVALCALVILLGQFNAGGKSSALAGVPQAPPPKDGIYALTPYRGLRIHRVVMNGKTTYEAPDWAISKSSFQDVHYEVNRRKFRAVTGIAASSLEARYAAADYDRNGHLAWFEIKRFQAALVREFEYRHNDIALRPDQFLMTGAGDCEDFALYTAGLLRYWGWNNWIGGIYDTTGYVGHAVCLVRVGDDVPSELSYYLRPKAVQGYSEVPAGRYIPIDYASVGSLSTAADATDRLVYVWVPEEIYGVRM